MRRDRAEVDRTPRPLSAHLYPIQARAVLDRSKASLAIIATAMIQTWETSRRRAIASGDTGVLLITHYTRILRYVKPDFVHVFAAGRVVAEGGPELADELEEQGYEKYVKAGASL